MSPAAAGTGAPADKLPVRAAPSLFTPSAQRDPGYARCTLCEFEVWMTTGWGRTARQRRSEAEKELEKHHMKRHRVGHRLSRLTQPRKTPDGRWSRARYGAKVCPCGMSKVPSGTRMSETVLRCGDCDHYKIPYWPGWVSVEQLRWLVKHGKEGGSAKWARMALDNTAREAALPALPEEVSR